jgi:hypothetical protein
MCLAIRNDAGRRSNSTIAAQRGRSSVVDVRRAELIETAEPGAAALQLPDPGDHALATRPTRLIYVRNDDLPVGRLGNAGSDAAGRERGACVGVERIPGDVDAELPDAGMADGL